MWGEKLTIIELHFSMKKEAVIKKLNPRHIIVIQLHLQGAPLKEISDQTGLSVWWICRILKSEPAKRLIAEYKAYFDQEFKALYTGSIKAIREGLQDPDINVRLRAAHMYLKAHDKYRDRQKNQEASAEDVIRRIIEIQKALKLETAESKTDFQQISAEKRKNQSVNYGNKQYALPWLVGSLTGKWPLPYF
jgi:uncharacterized protein YerC